MAQHVQLRIDTGLAIHFCDRSRTGNEAPTRTPTGSSANTFPKAPTSPGTAETTSTPSLTLSIPDLAKHSAGRPPPKPSTSFYALLNKAVLQRPVEHGYDPATRTSLIRS